MTGSSKIKTLFIFSLSCLLWISCSQNDKLPGGILPVNQMSEIMLDLQIAKAYNYSYSPEMDTMDYPQDQEARLKMLYQQIFMLHHTDTAHFFKSFRFYSNHPDWLKKVYTQMRDSLELKQTLQQGWVQQKRKSEEMRFQPKEKISSSMEKNFQTWQAFTDSAYQRCSKPKGIPSY